MTRSRLHRWSTLALAGTAAVAALAWFVRPAPTPAPAGDVADDPADAPRRPRAGSRAPRQPSTAQENRRADDEIAEEDEAALDMAEPAVGAGASARSPYALRRPPVLDAVDPCEPILEVEIPATHRRVSAEGVTVAWPEDVTATEPTALAFTVAGLLHEAAAVTGSARRARLTVFLHGSREDLHLATDTPEWASGVYDGAVHVVSEPRTDFGVRIATLRHEVMHAQLHEAAGCMPAWFNEGVSQYFSGRPPTGAWMSMLRERTGFDFEALSVPTIVEAPKGDEEKLYAQSLAMVLYVLDRSGEEGVQEIVQLLQEPDVMDPRRRARSLWKTLHPSVAASDVRTALASRIFGVSSESELDTLFHGPICCWGERRITDYQCRQAPPRLAIDGGNDLPPGARCARY